MIVSLPALLQCSMPGHIRWDFCHACFQPAQPCPAPQSPGTIPHSSCWASSSTNFSPELPNFIPVTQALLSCTVVCKKLTLRSITWHNKYHRRNVEAVSGGSLPSSRPPLSRARESLILCYHNQITYILFSSHKWSGIINKSTASLNWQRAPILIAVPLYIWSEMLRWWKAHASLCVFCSAREFCSAAPVQLSCAQAACVQPGLEQPWITRGLLHTHLCLTGPRLA